jgi:hypothetical protein
MNPFGPNPFGLFRAMLKIAVTGKRILIMIIAAQMP